MVRQNLHAERLRQFLDRPLVATLATYRRDGSALLSPVWQEWRDGGFDIVIGADDVKARHLRRDARASVAVYDSEPPYTGVELRTTATFSDADAHELTRRLAVRYLGEQRGAGYAAATAGESYAVLRLEPGHLRSWDYGDLLPADPN